jgi:hypothetical protein
MSAAMFNSTSVNTHMTAITYVPAAFVLCQRSNQYFIGDTYMSTRSRRDKVLARSMHKLHTFQRQGNDL